MWASPVSSRIIVTTQVEWTGRSFIKGALSLVECGLYFILVNLAFLGIIEKSAIEGQKTYHGDLEKAMRAYITEHQSEFIPEGVKIDPATIVAPEPAATSPTTEKVDGQTLSADQVRERERNARGLQWAYDTFEGAAKVAKDSTKTLLELLKDAWDQSSTTTILYFVITGLVISNLYTYSRMGSTITTTTVEEKRRVGATPGRRVEAEREDREKWIKTVVTALWDELAAGKVPSVAPANPSSQEPFKFDLSTLQGDINNLFQTLDDVEDKVKLIREGLKELQAEHLASGVLESLD
jgi:hypothetical protein